MQPGGGELQGCRVEEEHARRGVEGARPGGTAVHSGWGGRRRRARGRLRSLSSGGRRWRGRCKVAICGAWDRVEGERVCGLDGVGGEREWGRRSVETGEKCGQLRVLFSFGTVG
jgi:hypothetical protein